MGYSGAFALVGADELHDTPLRGLVYLSDFGRSRELLDVDVGVLEVNLRVLHVYLLLLVSQSDRCQVAGVRVVPVRRHALR